MSDIVLRSVSKSYGSKALTAVNAVDLSIAEGEFVVLLGPSGCGKTTTLRMIAGFVAPTSGQILFGGRDVTSVLPRLRNVGMVFQNYALFPNMTVADNIAFGPRQRGMERSKIAQRVLELLTLVQLESRRDYFPHELSGGQQQRVALARALAFSPSVLLLDEPLGALDVQLRESMQDELRRIQQSLGITTVLVTHDQHEAMALADRIVIMADGIIQQIGSPRDLYQKPANRFVADFLGKSNFLTGISTRRDSRHFAALADGSMIELPSVSSSSEGAPVEIALRPENIDLNPVPGEMAALQGKVVARRFLGNLVQYEVQMGWGQTILAECATRRGLAEVGDAITLGWKPEHIIQFRSASHSG